MYKASKLITTAGMYTLYCSLFQPYISYGNEIWGNNYASNVKCLYVIQRKAVRLICNADRLAHTNELYKELYILKFPEFVQYMVKVPTPLTTLVLHGGGKIMPYYRITFLIYHIVIFNIEASTLSEIMLKYLPIEPRQVTMNTFFLIWLF